MNLQTGFTREIFEKLFVEQLIIMLHYFLAAGVRKIPGSARCSDC